MSLNSFVWDVEISFVIMESEAFADRLVGVGDSGNASEAADEQLVAFDYRVVTVV